MTILERTYGIGQGFSPEGRSLQRDRHSEARLGAARLRHTDALTQCKAITHNHQSFEDARACYLGEPTSGPFCSICLGHGDHRHECE